MTVRNSVEIGNGSTRIMEHKKWDCNSKGGYEDYEIKREELEAILKKLTNRIVSGVDNVTFEL
jgi:hypothetical protein